ncbi:MAG TPA: hypothetical protein VLX92_03425 [Kofleriaceae bacterium]|nr:hypothetical protein [Kofleriaceae bacterium]
MPKDPKQNPKEDKPTVERERHDAPVRHDQPPPADEEVTAEDVVSIEDIELDDLFDQDGPDA